MPLSSPCPAPDNVQAWYAATTHLSDPHRVDRALAWLAPAERDRYARFFGDEDRRMFLLGRTMARTLVGRAAGIAPTAWQWREGPHGRPEIGSPDSSLRFNLAHSAGLVVCALASGREVGIDVEDLARRPIDPALVRRYCAPAEIADIDAQPRHQWHHRFLIYWTLKEAYLKARGLGISVPLANICFSLDSNAARISFRDSLAGTDDRWTFHLTQPTDRHLVAIAASTTDGVLPAFTVDAFVMDDGR